MKSSKITVGWREWVGLPAFDVDAIKVKIDTGALTSAIHAEKIERFRRRGKAMVRFGVLPEQDSRKGMVVVTCPVVDERRIRSSNGQLEHRPVVHTALELAGWEWDIELTLTKRDVMGFRMLLGRRAMRGHLVVDPARSFLCGD